jgi:hypothetical protein
MSNARRSGGLFPVPMAISLPVSYRHAFSASHDEERTPSVDPTGRLHIGPGFAVAGGMAGFNAETLRNRTGRAAHPS